MTTSEVDQTAATQETMSVAERQAPPQFIPSLRQEGYYPFDFGRSARHLEGYNPYEILLQTAKGQLLVFKHAIATIEIVDEPKGYRADI